MSVLLRFFSRVDSAFSETSKTFGILPISRSLLRENGYHRDMREPLSGAGASRCQVLARERAVASRKRPSGAGARTIVLAARSHHVAHRHHFGHPWDARPPCLRGAGGLRAYHPRRGHRRRSHPARAGNAGTGHGGARQQRLRRVRQRRGTFRAPGFRRRALFGGPQAGRRAHQLRRLRQR